MDKYLRFQNTIFCASNCNFLRFSAQYLSLLLTFSLFLLLITYLQLSIPHCIVNKIPTPQFNVMFKFNYSKYNPRGPIFRRMVDFATTDADIQLCFIL